MSTSPSVKLSSREVYRGRIFRVEVDRVRLPTGHTVDMEVVRHPGSVVILAQPSPDTVVLIRRMPLHARSLHLGTAGREPQDGGSRRAAARECEEEIGRRPAASSASAASIRRRVLRRADDLLPLHGAAPPAPDSTARKDDDEDIEPRTFSVDEVRALIAAGDVVDLKTVAGLLLL